MLNKRLFVTFSLILLLTVATVLVVPTVSAQEWNASDELQFEQMENGAVQISNIQNYLHPKARSRAALDTAEREAKLYNALGYSSEQEVSALERQMILSAESVQMSSVDYVDKELVDSTNTVHENKIKISNYLYRVPSLDRGEEKGYFVSVTAEWIKMPSYRMQDLLVITGSNNSTYGAPSERYMSYSYKSSIYSGGQTDYFDYQYDLENPYSLILKKQMISEYSTLNTGYAMKVELPNDVLTIWTNTRYYEAKLNLQTTIYNTGSFNVYTAYGHHYLYGTPSITSGGGATIQFDKQTTNYPGQMLTIRQ